MQVLFHFYTMPFFNPILMFSIMFFKDKDIQDSDTLAHNEENFCKYFQQLKIKQSALFIYKDITYKCIPMQL